MGADPKVHSELPVNEYAIIVGIENYSAGLADPLQGPSLDALRFALWLSKRGLPPENVILLENKCDKWDGVLEREYARVLAEVRSHGIRSSNEPTFEKITDAWREHLLEISDNVDAATLWVYWSGHGLSFENKQELLLCSDLKYREPTFIYLSELEDGLRSGPHARFSRQRIIIDACSEQLRAGNRITSSTRQPDLFDPEPSIDQVVLNAVPQGSWAVQEQGGSLFTRSLLLALERLGEWPEEVLKLWQTVTETISQVEPSAGRHPRLRINSPRFSADWPRTALHITASLDELGVAGIPEGLIADVRAFVDEYLGSAAQPVAYGGRDLALEELNHWLLQEPRRPNAIICARAGMGKSALVLHWLKELQSLKSGFDVVFFPISSRFATINSSAALFEALSSEMQIRHGEPFKPKTNADANRAIFHELLQRRLPNERSLLIVVDGLDEAIGWEAGLGLFPPHTPEHVKILVTAREYGGETRQHWISRLGWHPAFTSEVDLHPLGFEGVRDVLSKMGIALGPLSDDLDALAARLTELSEGGDPLLVKWYTDELRAAAAAGQLDIALLERMPRGLRAIFGDWLEKQRKIWGADRLQEVEVSEFIAACACAKGPLMREDLRSLAPEVFTNAQKVVSAANHLRRFVIGDGVRTGFTFSHPRFREFFYDERLDASDRKQWGDRFLSYVKRHAEAISNGGVPPASASQYVVRSCLLHLEERASDPTELMPALNRPWFDAWQSLEGSPAGFLRDMQRASKLAMSMGSKGLYALIRANLLQSSAATSAAHIGKDLFAECLRARVIGPTLGLALARQADGLPRKVALLARLADVLDNDERGRVLKEALALAQTIEEEGTDPKAEALIEIVEHMAAGPEQEQVLLEALDAARDAAIAMTRASLLTRIAALAGPGVRAGVAREAAEACFATRQNTAWFCARQLARSSALVDPREAERWISDALEIARDITDPHLRSRALGEAAEYLPGARREPVITEALEAAQSIPASMPDWQALSLRSLLPLLDGERKSKVLDDIRQILPRLPEESARLHILSTLAEHAGALERRELLREAVALARSFAEDPKAASLGAPRRGWALLFVARLHDGPERAELLREAFDASQHIADGYARVDGIAAIADRLGKDERARFVAEMLSTVRHLPEPYDVCVGLCHCSALLESDHRAATLSEAVDIAGQIGVQHHRESALETIASSVGSPEDAVLFRRLLSESARFFFPYRLIRTLSERLKFVQPDTGLVEEACKLVRTILGSTDGVIAAISIAPFLDEDKRREVLALAWSFEENRSSDVAHAEALAAIGGQYTGAEHEQILAEAVTIARSVVDPAAAASALLAVALRTDGLLRKQLIREAKTNALAVDKDQPWDRAGALALVAEHLPVKERAAFLDELPNLLPFHGSERLLAVLANDWELVCQARGASPVVQAGELIQRLGSFYRGVFIEDLAALAPALDAIGGAVLLRNVAEAVIEAGKFWP